VREAVSLLVDREKISRDAYKNLARPVAGPVWRGGLGDGEPVKPLALDPARAGVLLDEAGWRDPTKSGLRSRGTDKLHVVLLATGEAKGDPERESIVGNLRKAGFSVEVHPGEPGSLLTKLQAGEFDAAVIDYHGRVDENLAPLFVTKGAMNWGGYSVKEVDRLCGELEETWEPAARGPRLTELGRLLAADSPLVPIVAAAPHGLVSNRVAGLVVRDGWFRIRSITLTR
jgi:peptide/nickel transport system substrate-binding protein